MEAETTEARSTGQSARDVSFAHESEREFAAILDFYQIRWEYEPRTFPLRWDQDGRPIESFTPDFYLVDHDLFVELTTLKQSLVTKKNRKLRLIRTLYPDVRIKLFYGRDFRSLMAKYGLDGNSHQLSAMSSQPSAVSDQLSEAVLAATALKVDD